jgi:endonuclease G
MRGLKGRAERFVRGFTGQAAVSLAMLAMIIGCDKGNGFQYPTPPEPEPLPTGYVWSELPEIYTSANTAVETHFARIGGVNRRNYTMLYDTSEKVSYWVAYPLHSVYLGNSGRTDAWAYDPSFAESEQMPIAFGGYGVRGYDRGHQLPSADRQATIEANEQTFYATNMTPQNSDLNQGEWASLEGWVRKRAAESHTGGRSDTLYVVTGCVLTTAEEPSVEHLSKNGVEGAIPKAYYKVLVRTRSGKATVPWNTDAECIGFWVENRAPSDGYASWAVSVAEVEARTGHTFFPKIAPSVKQTYNAATWALR